MPRWAWYIVLGLLTVLVWIAVLPRVVPPLLQLLPIAGEDP